MTLCTKLAVLAITVTLGACSANVVVDPDNDGGGGGGGGTTTTPSGCQSHEDCGSGNLCVFATGACTPSCQIDGCDACGPGLVCNACATSSCPDCRDCTAGCVPVEPLDCDDDDTCEPGFTCLFQERRCTPACSPDLACSDPSTQCDGCATGSCCSCKNCVSACVGD